MTRSTSAGGWEFVKRGPKPAVGRGSLAEGGGLWPREVGLGIDAYAEARRKKKWAR